MKATYRDLIVIGITFAAFFALRTSAAVGTNVVGKVSTTNSTVNHTIATNATTRVVVPKVADTEMVHDVYAYFTASPIDIAIQHGRDENFFGVHWMDTLMNAVDFDSITIDGAGRFGIDTAMMRVVSIHQSLCFGPFYDAWYPLSSVGPMTDVATIGFAFKWDL